MNTITKIKTAAGAAWKVTFIAWGMTAFTYLAYLSMSAGWLDPLISLGIYGPVTREHMLLTTFCFIGLMKLIGMVCFLGSLFLSSWWRKLQKAETSHG